MAKWDFDILDRFDDEPEKQWLYHPLVVYGPIIILIIGVIFHTMHWPASKLIILIGLMAMMVRSSIFFFSKRRKIAEWAYFVGRQFFSVLIVMLFIGFSIDRTYLITSFLLFAGGWAFFEFNKKKDQDETTNEDKIEDDY